MYSMEQIIIRIQEQNGQEWSLLFPAKSLACLSIGMGGFIPDSKQQKILKFVRIFKLKNRSYEISGSTCKRIRRS